MKLNTKRFLMTGVLVISIFLIVGSIWLASVSDESATAKNIFYVVTAGVVVCLVRMFYFQIVKTGELTLIHGVFCELEAFFLLEQPRQIFFNEVLEGIQKSGDVTFFTQKPIAESKAMLRQLTSKSFPIILISNLDGKKVEVLVSSRHQVEFETRGIGFQYFILLKEREEKMKR